MKREDIAEMLKIGATRCEDIRDLLDEMNGKPSCECLEEESTKMRDMAAQVNQMRCETCAKERRLTVDETASAHVVIFCPWQGCGGCFQHEPKGEN